MDSFKAEKTASDLKGKAVRGWVVGDLIDHGKSALVLRAKREGRDGALKVFDPEIIRKFGAEEQTGRVQRELALVGQVHPNLVRVLDGGTCEETGCVFIVMEYIEAPNLASVLDQVPRERIADIIRQVADAARFLEGLKLAHRDIKPANIAISPDFTKATLLDLGVVRPFGVDDLTDGAKREFVGTLRYSPPEFMYRREEDSPDGWRAVTFYQIGGVLHDLIMGRPLFSEFSPYTRLVSAVERETPRIEAIGVPPRLVKLALTCLAKDPRDRLTCLDWDDFEEASEPADIESRRTAIRKKLDSARVRRKGEGSAAAPDADDEVRRTLSGLRDSIKMLVLHECAQSDLYPPCEKREYGGVSPDICHFLAHFDEAPDAVLGQMAICLTLKLRDAQSKSIELSASAALLPTGEDDSFVRGLPPVRLYSGAYVEKEMEEVIAGLLTQVLDASLDLCESRPGRIAEAEPLLHNTEGETSE